MILHNEYENMDEASEDESRVQPVKEELGNSKRMKYEH